jgi:O-antigen/teichoic acid export membrane protein
MADNLKEWITAHLWRSKTARSVAMLIAGTAGAQALTILSAPFVTRLYGPAAYGVFGVFSSLLAILASIGAMSYPMALVLPKEHREAVHVTRVSVIVALAVAVLLTLLWLLFQDSLKNLRGIAELGDYIGLLPLALLAGTWAQIATQWLTRRRDFKSISTITLFNAVWTNAARVLIGLAWPAVAVLVWVYILGQAALAARMAQVVRGGDRGESQEFSDPASKPARLFDAAWKYRDFPFYRAPQDFINAVSRGVPVIVLSSMSGPVAAGLYSLATQLMGMPSSLLGNAVVSVLYPDMVQRVHEGRSLTSIIVRGTAILALVGLIPFGALCLFGPSLFAVVFGEGWRGAGSYCQWLAVFYYLNFINKPAVAAIPTLGAQRGLLTYEVVGTLAKLGGVYAGFRLFGSDLAAVALFSVTGAAAYAALIAWVILVSSGKDANGQTG